MVDFPTQIHASISIAQPLRYVRQVKTNLSCYTIVTYVNIRPKKFMKFPPQLFRNDTGRKLTNAGNNITVLVEAIICLMQVPTNLLNA